jgi:hypothetical protein
MAQQRRRYAGRAASLPWAQHWQVVRSLRALPFFYLTGTPPDVAGPSGFRHVSVGCWRCGARLKA